MQLLPVLPGIVEAGTPTWWWVCMAVALVTASFTGMGLLWLVSSGVGVWGLANPINWGWAIVNFVVNLLSTATLASMHFRLYEQIGSNGLADVRLGSAKETKDTPKRAYRLARSVPDGTEAPPGASSKSIRISAIPLGSPK